MITYYLYKKTHRTTGLKYLGQTKSPDPHRYKGSGKEWKKHIQEHGYDVDTEILLETTDPKLIEELGRHYSSLWNVVDNSEWANMRPELGHGGGLGEEGYKRLSEKLTGHPNWLLKQTDSGIEKIRKAQKELWSTYSTEEKTNRMKNSACNPDSYTPERIEKARLNSIGKKKTKTLKLIEAERQRKIRIQADPLKCGDSNRGKTWKVIDGKRVWFTKEK